MATRRRAPDAILERLTALHPKLIDLSLGRIERLLAALGNPERRLPPVIHVAGTNGKGSVTAYLAAMARAAGLRAHVYTSPHLVRFNERIAVAGAEIDDETLSAYLESCEAANAGQPITFFEITTAAALLAFAEAPADIAILEVGLGGRLDATNVIARPAVTAITPVSIDHTQHLGGTLAEIAAEKAGILKPAVVAVIGPQQPEAARVIAARARAIGAPLRRHGVEWRAEDMDLPPPSLHGAHQIANAATAAVCAREFGLDADAIVRGVATARWPARLQELKRGPLAATLPANVALWLDGGHNPGAAAALAQWIGSGGLPVDLVVGMINTKDAAGFFAPLAAYVRNLRAVVIPDEKNSLTAAEVAAHACAAGIAAKPADSVAAAIAELALDRPARILICGSLYLAGRVLRENG
jgi:dihydrofolate synthase/folylpolyglutamate synthase